MLSEDRQGGSASPKTMLIFGAEGAIIEQRVGDNAFHLQLLACCKEVPKSLEA
jgi:hypothetical protein